MLFSSRLTFPRLSICVVPALLVAATTPSLAQQTSSKSPSQPALFGWAKMTNQGVIVAGAYFPGGGWRSEEVARSFALPGQTWQVMNLSGKKLQVTTDRAKPGEGPYGYFAETRSTAKPNEDAPEAIALSAPYAKNAQPRLPRPQSLNQPLYIQAATKLLQTATPKAKATLLSQLLRVDLNGDGQEEVLMSAHSRPDYGRTPEIKAGDFDLTAIRFVHKGKVKTLAFTCEVAIKGSTFSAPNRTEFLAFADIDGDGKMEIVLSTGYYEGMGLEIWKFDGQDVKRVAAAGWGA